MGCQHMVLLPAQRLVHRTFGTFNDSEGIEVRLIPFIVIKPNLTSTLVPPVSKSAGRRRRQMPRLATSS